MRDVSATTGLPRLRQTRGSPHHTPRRVRLEGRRAGKLEKRAVSASHAEAAEFAARFGPADLHVFDSRGGRAVPAPDDELLDLCLLALDDRFDFAAGEVA